MVLDQMGLTVPGDHRELLVLREGRETQYVFGHCLFRDHIHLSPPHMQGPPGPTGAAGRNGTQGVPGKDASPGDRGTDGIPVCVCAVLY